MDCCLIIEMGDGFLVILLNNHIHGEGHFLNILVFGNRKGSWCFFLALGEGCTLFPSAKSPMLLARLNTQWSFIAKSVC
jgi:hypothetical protein